MVAKEAGLHNSASQFSVQQDALQPCVGAENFPRTFLQTLHQRCNNSFLPHAQPYTLGECLRDLLELSARLLVRGGRLVYFLPATPETYGPDQVPQHPALEVVANRWAWGGVSKVQGCLSGWVECLRVHCTSRLRVYCIESPDCGCRLSRGPSVRSEQILTSRYSRRLVTMEKVGAL